jgi:hypothetical protein
MRLLLADSERRRHEVGAEPNCAFRARVMQGIHFSPLPRTGSGPHCPHYCNSCICESHGTTSSYGGIEEAAASRSALRLRTLSIIVRVERLGDGRGSEGGRPSEVGGRNFDGVAGGRKAVSSRGHVTAPLVMGVSLLWSSRIDTEVCLEGPIPPHPEA